MSTTVLYSFEHGGYKLQLVRALVPGVLQDTLYEVSLSHRGLVLDWYSWEGEGNLKGELDVLFDMRKRILNGECLVDLPREDLL